MRTTAIALCFLVTACSSDPGDADATESRGGPAADIWRPRTDTGAHGPDRRDPGCEPSKTCADYPGQCGTALADGCVGTIDCANACVPPLVCGPDAQCGEPAACEADCTDRECGNDGCDGSCGTCGEDEACVEGTCTPFCTPVCDVATCGDDGCGGTCGECSEGDECVDGACQPIVPPAPLAVINEVLADPDAGDTLGDSNCDGVRDGTDDELVEIVNAGDALLDLSGATLSDLVGVRHAFAPGTELAAGGVIVVFGGGSPSFGEGSPNASAWCQALPEGVTVLIADSSKLGLNNDGDVLTLASSEGVELATASWGTDATDAAAGESLVRAPEILGEWTLHTQVDGSIGPQSPGRAADGSAL